MGVDVVWLLQARGGAAGGRPGWFDLVCCFIVLYISRISLAWQLWHEEDGGDSTRVEWWRTAGSGGSYSGGGLGCNDGFRSLCFHKYELGLGPILEPGPRSLSGLGAVLLSLLKNRTLDVLLSKGKEYVLLVDSDNVAAKIDPKIAQTSVRDSMERFKLVDTGSLWVNVKALKRLLDPDEIKIEDISVSKETESDQVLLQESAVGSPIQSNLYMYDDEGGIVRNIARTNLANPLIELGPEFDKVSDLLSRFNSMPDIIDLDSLKVTGDVWFGAGITLKGRVTIHAKPGMKLEIPDGVVIENEVIENRSDF